MAMKAFFLSRDSDRFMEIKKDLEESSLELEKLSTGKMPSEKPEAILFDTTYSFDEVSDTIDRIQEKHGFIPTLLISESTEAPGGYLLLASGLLSGDTAEKIVDELEEFVMDPTNLPYPVPEEEEERIEEILEMDIERLKGDPMLVQLAERAIEFFEVDDCYIGLILKDEERFLAYPNTDRESLDRSATICTYGILEEGITEVEEVQKDQRFRYIEQLSELDINSYAGAPINLEGSNIGMFCLVDSEPITLSNSDKKVLRKFSEASVKLIELLRSMER